jgi:RimJ/RimL family protein N-acetyltransferase
VRLERARREKQGVRDRRRRGERHEWTEDKVISIPSKKQLVASLPLHTNDLVIRQWRRGDLDRFAKWPAYSFPYQAFNFSFRDMHAGELDNFFTVREADLNRITLSIDLGADPAIAYLALSTIEWQARRVDNFGFRLHPDQCDRGLGTQILCMVADWLFRGGIDCIAADVAASNGRAVRCYEKAGFLQVGTLWREAPDLQEVDLSTSRSDFLRPHVRFENGMPELRFWLMDRSKGSS